MTESFIKKFLAEQGGHRIGLLANQTAYSLQDRAYTFQLLARHCDSLRIFLPEHGLFAELQDQIGLEETSAYAAFLGSEENSRTEFLSLYGFKEKSLKPQSSRLSDLDWLIVDLQDVGSRYYTFLTTMFYCLQVIQELRGDGSHLRCLVLDRPNPLGRIVEGSILDQEYESFVGLPGVIHRHGLSTGEMARLFCKWLGMDPAAVLVQTWGTAISDGHPPASNLESQYLDGTSDGIDSRNEFLIYPSPNMPTLNTAMVYPGQCLLEGTNLSEGRGCTRPFEIFGAPFLGPLMEQAPLFVPGATLRPLRFMPTFHKHADLICEGFQLHITGPEFAPLFATLRILRWIRSHIQEFQWKTGVYEFRSDRPAIELLAGDPWMLEYLRNSPAPSQNELDNHDETLLQHMSVQEAKWMQQTAYLWADQTPLHSSSARILQKFI